MELTKLLRRPPVRPLEQYHLPSHNLDPVPAHALHGDADQPLAVFDNAIVLVNVRRQTLLHIDDEEKRIGCLEEGGHV